MRSRIVFVAIAAIVVLVLYNSFPKAVTRSMGSLRQGLGTAQTGHSLHGQVEGLVSEGYGLVIVGTDF